MITPIVTISAKPPIAPKTKSIATKLKFPSSGFGGWVGSSIGSVS